MASSVESTVELLLGRYGRTSAEQAGIRLADEPAPLYQLLVLATLVSAPISTDIAAAAAKELFEAGYGTPQRMREASWQERVDALGRGGYRRYDERTSTMLGEGAALLIDRWGADLRSLRDEAGGDPKRIGELLTAFKGIGPVGAAVFLQEVQVVWPQVVPYLDQRAVEGADKVGLPSDARGLSELVGSPRDLARLASALVQVSRRSRVAEEVRHAASEA